MAPPHHSEGHRAPEVQVGPVEEDTLRGVEGVREEQGAAEPPHQSEGQRAQDIQVQHGAAGQDQQSK